MCCRLKPMKEKNQKYQRMYEEEFLTLNSYFDFIISL